VEGRSRACGRAGPISVMQAAWTVQETIEPSGDGAGPSVSSDGLQFQLKFVFMR